MDNHALFDCGYPIYSLYFLPFAGLSSADHLGTACSGRSQSSWPGISAIFDYPRRDPVHDARKRHNQRHWLKSGIFGSW
jgi:hypothetical protein